MIWCGVSPGTPKDRGGDAKKVPFVYFFEWKILKIDTLIRDTLKKPIPKRSFFDVDFLKRDRGTWLLPGFQYW